MNKSLGSEVKAFIKKIDPSSWPAFVMFAIVLLAAGGLNYIGMAPVIGDVLAVAIALFFGFGVLSWHIVESRTDDSQYQEDVARLVKWLNVILDGILIVVNLFRAELRNQLVAGMTAADTLAFACIGISAMAHVVAFLLWTQNDPRRLNKKELERGMSDVKQRGARAEISIKKTEEHLKKLKWIQDEEIRLRKEYADLDPERVETLVMSMRQKALSEFEEVQPQDVQPTQALRPAFAANTKQAKLADPTRGESK